MTYRDSPTSWHLRLLENPVGLLVVAVLIIVALGYASKMAEYRSEQPAAAGVAQELQPQPSAGQSPAHHQTGAEQIQP